MTVSVEQGIQNIIEGQGISIALTGMLIVFVALGLITISIYLLPKILDISAKVIPQKAEIQEISGDSKSAEDEIIAAIGYTFYKSIANSLPGNKKIK